MGIKKPRFPESRQVGNTLLILAGLLLIAYIVLPRRQPPRIPYSIFIKQVEEGQVAGVQLGDNEIRYRLKGKKEGELGPVLATTPVFDPELPKRLEKSKVVFQAAPPPNNTWNVLLNWIIPPLDSGGGFSVLYETGSRRGSIHS